jgi:hypothetical protein
MAYIGIEDAFTEMAKGRFDFQSGVREPYCVASGGP